MTEANNWQKTRVMKKYANRKIYDPSQGYITIKKVVELIRAGEKVQVINKDDGKDVTSKVITSALLEEKELKEESFADILHTAIAKYGSLNKLIKEAIQQNS